MWKLSTITFSMAALLEKEQHCTKQFVLSSKPRATYLKRKDIFVLHLIFMIINLKSISKTPSFTSHLLVSSYPRNELKINLHISKTLKLSKI